MLYYSHRIGREGHRTVKRKPASFSIRQDYLAKLEQIVEEKQKHWAPSSKSAVVEEALTDLFDKYDKGESLF